jgi:aspartate racemase
MEASYTSDRFREKYGIEIITPDEEDQIIIDQVIFDELVKGCFFDASRQKYVEICKRLGDKGAEGVILGCSEIFLLFSQPDMPEMPMFNTTELHVEAAVNMALATDT